LKNEGNNYFKKFNYSNAIDTYLNSLKTIKQDKTIGNNIEIKNLKLTLNINLSNAYHKINSFE
jgi:hypothetical protein